MKTNIQITFCNFWHPDYAATSVENGNENDGQKKVHENSDEQTTPNESTEDQQQEMKDEMQPNRISGQSEATTPKRVKIDALYLLNKFNNMVKQYLGNSKLTAGSTEKEFDLDEFRGRVMSDRRFELNKTWYEDYFIMSCPAKSYIERFSVQGEFF